MDSVSWATHGVAHTQSHANQKVEQFDQQHGIVDGGVVEKPRKKNGIRASNDSRSCTPGVSNSIANISFRKRIKMSSFPTTFLLDCLALLNTWHWKSGLHFIWFVIGLINVAASLCLNLYYLVGKPPVRLENHSFGWKTNRTRQGLGFRV